MIRAAWVGGGPVYLTALRSISDSSGQGLGLGQELGEARTKSKDTESEDTVYGLCSSWLATPTSLYNTGPVRGHTTYSYQFREMHNRLAPKLV